jgi:hypothetical protein
MYEFESVICMKPSMFKHDDLELEGNLILTNYRLTFLLKNKDMIVSEDFFSVPILSIIK